MAARAAAARRAGRGRRGRAPRAAAAAAAAAALLLARAGAPGALGITQDEARDAIDAMYQYAEETYLNSGAAGMPRCVAAHDSSNVTANVAACPDGAPASLDEARARAWELAPLLRFHPLEQFFPGAVEDWLAAARVFLASGELVGDATERTVKNITAQTTQIFDEAISVSSVSYMSAMDNVTAGAQFDPAAQSFDYTGSPFETVGGNGTGGGADGGGGGSAGDSSGGGGFEAYGSSTAPLYYNVYATNQSTYVFNFFVWYPWNGCSDLQLTLTSFGAWEWLDFVACAVGVHEGDWEGTSVEVCASSLAGDGEPVILKQWIRSHGWNAVYDCTAGECSLANASAAASEGMPGVLSTHSEVLVAQNSHAGYHRDLEASEVVYVEITGDDLLVPDIHGLFVTDRTWTGRSAFALGVVDGSDGGAGGNSSDGNATNTSANASSTVGAESLAGSNEFGLRVLIPTADNVIELPDPSEVDLSQAALSAIPEDQRFDLNDTSWNVYQGLWGRSFIESFAVFEPYCYVERQTALVNCNALKVTFAGIMEAAFEVLGVASDASFGIEEDAADGADDSDSARLGSFCGAVIIGSTQEAAALSTNGPTGPSSKVYWATPEVAKAYPRQAAVAANASNLTAEPFCANYSTTRADEEEFPWFDSYSDGLLGAVLAVIACIGVLVALLIALSVLAPESTDESSGRCARCLWWTYGLLPGWMLTALILAIIGFVMSVVSLTQGVDLMDRYFSTSDTWASLKVVLYVFLALVMALDIIVFLFALFATDEDRPIWRIHWFTRSKPWMKRHGGTVLFVFTFLVVMAAFLSALYMAAGAIIWFVKTLLDDGCSIFNEGAERVCIDLSGFGLSSIGCQTGLQVDVIQFCNNWESFHPEVLAVGGLVLTLAQMILLIQVGYDICFFKRVFMEYRQLEHVPGDIKEPDAPQFMTEDALKGARGADAKVATTDGKAAAQLTPPTQHEATAMPSYADFDSDIEADRENLNGAAAPNAGAEGAPNGSRRAVELAEFAV